MLQLDGPSDKQVLFELDVKSSTLQNGRSAWSRSPYWTDVVTTAGDPFAGLRKLMKALEDSMGRTEMDRKAELRKQFYQNIRRAAGERISTLHHVPSLDR